MTVASPPLPGIAFEAVPPRRRRDACRAWTSPASSASPRAARSTSRSRSRTRSRSATCSAPDPELARTDDGTPVRAHLGPAVEAFFANGGRRAWVVRVAATGPEGAVTNRFRVPGLLLPGSSTEGARGWRAVTMPARSAGAWSDALTVGAALEVATTLPVVVEPTPWSSITRPTSWRVTCCGSCSPTTSPSWWRRGRSRPTRVAARWTSTLVPATSSSGGFRRPTTRRTGSATARLSRSPASRRTTTLVRHSSSLRRRSRWPRATCWLRSRPRTTG